MKHNEMGNKKELYHDEMPFKEEVGKHGMDAMPIMDTETSRVIPFVKKGEAVDKIISPVAKNFREPYNETNSPETNLHDQFVKPNQIETTPRSFKQ